MSEVPGRNEVLAAACRFYASYAIACGMVICFAAVFIQFLPWFFPALDIRGIAPGLYSGGAGSLLLVLAGQAPAHCAETDGLLPRHGDG